MNFFQKIAVLSVASLISVQSMQAQTPATVVDIAAGSANHTTLVAAVKAADLVPTLQSR